MNTSACPKYFSSKNATLWSDVTYYFPNFFSQDFPIFKIKEEIRVSRQVSMGQKRTPFQIDFSQIILIIRPRITAYALTCLRCWVMCLQQPGLLWPISVSHQYASLSWTDKISKLPPLPIRFIGFCSFSCHKIILKFFIFHPSFGPITVLHKTNLVRLTHVASSSTKWTTLPYTPRFLYVKCWTSLYHHHCLSRDWHWPTTFSISALPSSIYVSRGTTLVAQTSLTRPSCTLFCWFVLQCKSGAHFKLVTFATLLRLLTEYHFKKPFTSFLPRITSVTGNIISHILPYLPFILYQAKSSTVSSPLH